MTGPAGTGDGPGPDGRGRDGRRGAAEGGPAGVGASVVGIDLGGTTVRVVAAGDGGRVLHRASVRHAARGYPAVLALADQVVARCREVLGPRPVRAVGVAVAGWLSADREELLAAANLGVTGVPLRRDLERRLGLPVAVENDGNAAALAEARAGAGLHARMLVMLTLGTGVGGGIVARGSLVTGAAGLAGELGHMPSGSDGPPCACGGRGCLEASASGPALARLAARAWRGKRPLSQVSAGDTEMAEDAMTGTGTVTAEDVVTAARAGDRAAAGVLHAAGQAVGRAVAWLVPVLNPDLILLGGGLAAGATDLLLIPARRALAEATPLSSVTPVPSIHLATCGADAGALGATYLPDMNGSRAHAGAPS